MNEEIIFVFTCIYIRVNWPFSKVPSSYALSGEFYGELQQLILLVTNIWWQKYGIHVANNSITLETQRTSVEGRWFILIHVNFYYGKLNTPKMKCVICNINTYHHLSQLKDCWLEGIQQIKSLCKNYILDIKR